MSSYMPVYLSLTPADEQWGPKALLSINDQGYTIHLTSPTRLCAVQQAARKLTTQGIKHVALVGEGWDLEKTWFFWLGFRSPKRAESVQWPALSAEDEKQLHYRLKSIDWVRDTINLPAQELGPVQLAQRAIDLLSDVGGQYIHYSVIRGDSLKEKGYMGVYTVGKGSERDPALLCLDYNPTNNPDEPVIACLVGKGITFDSGGYNLKSSQFINSMKADMGGAALAAGSLAFAIQQGLNKRVKLILCCADNLVSGKAFKLGDIIHYRNGKTVEVNNTDAEGRLVLADGLIDADKMQPKVIIDCATLTGAAKTAVGTEYHALLSFDDQMIAHFLQSAQETHELFWRLPLAEFHRSQLPSAFADLNNIASANYSAGASTAAAFLSHFVENYHHNWLHIDCSATYQKSASDMWATGATGNGVKTVAHYLLSLSHD